MRLWSALRGREGSYSSLNRTQPANPSPPQRQVERLTPAERLEAFTERLEALTPSPIRRTVTELGPYEPSPILRSVTESNGDFEYQMATGADELQDMDFNTRLAQLQSFQSEPSPPPYLWDTDDAQYLDRVMCHCRVWLTHIDPVNGSFEGRMKCSWATRTLNTRERTEARIRVPGIRLPDMFSNVEESRLWRHLEGDTDKTCAWQGTSVFSFNGFKIFDVQDFPFDRQAVTLQLFEFVWRENKNTDVFHEAMKVVSFTMETTSMLPEWTTYSAVIQPCDVLKPGSGPTYGTRFVVKLRIERKAGYYLMHICLVSLLIFVAAVLPLAFEPGTAHVGDRLYLHSGGLLTLVAFKNVVASELPRVPYPTFINNFINAQLWTLVAVSIESILSYLAVDVYHVPKEILDGCEDFLLILLLSLWISYFVYIAFNKERKSWEEVMCKKEPGECENSCF